MNRIESQKKLYAEWTEISNRLVKLEFEEDKAKAQGNKAFELLKDVDIDKAYEAGDNSGWLRADTISEEMEELQSKSKIIYETMEKNEFPDLTNFESCAQIGFSSKKKVEIIFLDGEKRVGFIYPWEGDYSGPPYYFNGVIDDIPDDSYSLYLDNGWEIAEIKEII